MARIVEGAERVLVTGASGVIAAACAEALLAGGSEVVATTRDPRSERARRLAARGAVVVRADLSDPATALALPPADVLLHLAESRDEAAGRGPVWRDNVGATCNLLDWARRSQVRRVVLRSAAQVVGPLLAAECPVLEEHACEPAGLHLRARLAAERVAHQWSRKHAIAVSVARLAPVFGGGARWEPLDRALRFARTGVLAAPPRDVLVQGLHLRDAVAGLALLVADERRTFRTYHVTGMEPRSEADLFREVVDLAGRPSLAERLPRRPLDAASTAHQAWNGGRLAEELRFRPRAGIAAEVIEGLRRTAPTAVQVPPPAPLPAQVQALGSRLVGGFRSLLGTA